MSHNSESCAIFFGHLKSLNDNLRCTRILLNNNFYNGSPSAMRFGIDFPHANFQQAAATSAYVFLDAKAKYQNQNTNFQKVTYYQLPLFCRIIVELSLNWMISNQW